MLQMLRRDAAAWPASEDAFGRPVDQSTRAREQDRRVARNLTRRGAHSLPNLALALCPASSALRRFFCLPSLYDVGYYAALVTRFFPHPCHSFDSIRPAPHLSPVGMLGTIVLFALAGSAAATAAIPHSDATIELTRRDPGLTNLDGSANITSLLAEASRLAQCVPSGRRTQ